MRNPTGVLRDARIAPDTDQCGGLPRSGRRVRAAPAAILIVVAALVVAPLPAAGQTAPTTVQPSSPVRQTLDGGHAGSAACRECHAAQYDAWARSQHSRAMQVADAQSVLGDFRNVRFAYAGITSTFYVRDGKYYVRTDGPDGKLADFEVRYTFGVAPLQQYLIELPGGRLQALSIAWDARPKSDGGQRWFHLYPGQKLRAGDPLHWTGVSQNWNFMCAECHSTNLRKGFDAQKRRFDTTWSEIGVGCEACHGPGAVHVAWGRAKREGKAPPSAHDGLAVALTERKGVAWTPVAATGNAQRSAPRNSSREIETCARCHARAARISDDYVHGKPPLDTHRLALLDEGLYWSDGQMRDEVYNWGSFVQSRMHAKGVTCSDCHDPHTQALHAPGNAVCAQCHLASKFDAPSHTHHAQGAPGGACAACHMPTTTYMQVDPRHDHSMRIPRPDLSAKLGIPNACNNCHAKQTPQWAADAIAKWNGKAVGYQNFAEALRAGTLGAPGARGALMAIIDDSAQPAIVRASALARLAPWLTPSSLGPVTRALNDTDPLVRSAAVEALGAADPSLRLRYLPRMLADPVRSVRIEAARALAGPTEANLPAADRAAFDKALAEYMAAQTYNADRPEGRLSLGNLSAARGDLDRALTEFRMAIEIDPASAEARVNLADLYRARGAEREAEAVLRDGIAIAPRAAALHHSLGLALVRQKRNADGLRELAEAVKLAPADPRFAYVYAVALNDTGKPKEALQILKDALKRNPYDRDLLVVLAHYSAAAGQRDAALGYARQLVGLEPENREYARLAASLGAVAPR
jgi:tetratricopeptide (TPR) repeat protein